ncbi:MAG TPA: glycosyltransferase family 2 protein, partial [Victivallales bacterium]|nr:glycosyltransferase family 2 protein [Victivallales bacterium]
MHKISPFFSIIIPTRNRADTLYYSIKTVLNQNFSDYELIICDNNSTCETAKIVADFNNDKIKYIKSEKDLAMSDNWELALSKASGRYNIIFGDDDGIMPYALSELFIIINKTGAKLIKWDRIFYNWPTIIVKEVANLTTVPLGSSFRYVDSYKLIRKVIKNKLGYEYLPMFYNSAVHKDLIAKAKKKAGRVFYATQPDIYSGYLFAHLSKKTLIIQKPMTINGGSANSSGSAINTKKFQERIDAFNSLYTNSLITFNKSIPQVRSVSGYIIEPFLQLKKIYPEITYNIKRKKIITAIANNLQVLDIEEWNASRNIIASSIKNNKKLNRWFQKYWEKLGIKIIRKYEKSNNPVLCGETITIDASNFNITNVYEISVFVSSLLKGYNLDDKEVDRLIKEAKSLKRIIKNIIKY